MTTCNGCHRETTASKPPPGWHRRGANLLCATCWGAKYSPRSITVPIAAPGADVWTAMRAGWDRSRRLANWAMRELFLRDIPPAPGAKLERWQRPYLYGIFAREYPYASEWAGAKSSALCVLRSAESLYKQKRFNVLATGTASLPSFRSDAVPIPLDRDQWSLSEDDGVMVVSLSLPGGRISVRLRGGQGFRRQIGVLRRVLSGEIPAGEVKIFERRIGRFGSPEQSGRIMVSFAVHMPVENRAEDAEREDRTLMLRTDSESFWIALFPDTNQLWYLHADHIRQCVAAGRRLRQRLADDLKHERRWSKAVRDDVTRRHAATLEKQRNRLESWSHEATSMLVGLCRRRRISEVRYNDADRGYLDSYPWFVLQAKLESKLHAAGIRMVKASRKEADEWESRAEWIAAAAATKGTARLLKSHARGVVPLARPVSRRAVK